MRIMIRYGDRIRTQQEIVGGKVERKFRETSAVDVRSKVGVLKSMMTQIEGFVNHGRKSTQQP